MSHPDLPPTAPSNGPAGRALLQRDFPNSMQTIFGKGNLIQPIDRRGGQINQRPSADSASCSQSSVNSAAGPSPSCEEPRSPKIIDSLIGDTVCYRFFEQQIVLL